MTKDFAAVKRLPMRSDNSTYLYTHWLVDKIGAMTDCSAYHKIF